MCGGGFVWWKWCSWGVRVDLVPHVSVCASVVLLRIISVTVVCMGWCC